MLIVDQAIPADDVTCDSCESPASFRIVALNPDNPDGVPRDLAYFCSAHAEDYLRPPTELETDEDL